MAALSASADAILSLTLHELNVLYVSANALQQGASQFEQQAGKLKRKYWWKNLK
ncbi:hypothetical protein Cfor_08655, partial [Coptotermes formosanus]